MKAHQLASFLKLLPKSQQSPDTVMVVVRTVFCPETVVGKLSVMVVVAVAIPPKPTLQALPPIFMNSKS